MIKYNNLFKLIFLNPRMIEHKTNNDFFGTFYEDKNGIFWIEERKIQERIEAMVTNGRGYIQLNNMLQTPYAENPFRDKADPSIFCYRRLEKDKFPTWKKDLDEGHPEYSKTYFDITVLK